MEDKIKAILAEANKQIAELVRKDFPDAECFQTVCGWNDGEANYEVDCDPLD